MVGDHHRGDLLGPDLFIGCLHQLAAVSGVKRRGMLV